MPVLKAIGGYLRFQPLERIDKPESAGAGQHWRQLQPQQHERLDQPERAFVGDCHRRFSSSEMAALTSLDFLLATVGGAFNPQVFAALTTLAAPALTTVGGDFKPLTMAS